MYEQIDEQKNKKETCADCFCLRSSFLLRVVTYGSEENVDVLRPRVDDNVVDVSLFDLSQHLAVSVDRSLSDVHFHFASRWRSHKILQPQQPCPQQQQHITHYRIELLHNLMERNALVLKYQQKKATKGQDTI